MSRKTQSRSTAVVAALACFFPLLTGAAGAEGAPAAAAGPLPATPESAVRVARQHWEQYFTAMQSGALEGDHHFRRVNVSRGRVLHDGKSEFGFSGATVFARGLAPSAKGTVLAWGRNGDYSFRVESKDSGAAWGLKKLEWEPASTAGAVTLDAVIGNSPLGNLQNPHASVMSSVCRGLMIDNTWFPFIARAAAFRATKMETIEEDGRSMVRLAYEYEPGMAERSSVVGGGELVLDPGRYWLIRRAKVSGSHTEDPRQGTMEVTNDFADDVAPFPVVTRSTMRQVVPVRGKQPFEVEEVREYSYRPAGQASEKYVRLAGFGISEPTKPGASRRIWLYANLAFLLVLAGAAVLSAQRKGKAHDNGLPKAA